MRLTVIGSGSRGNSMVLQYRDESLIVDAGFGARTVLKRLEQCGLEIGTVVGVAITHEHGDHSSGAASLAKKFQCPVFGSQGTLGAIKVSLDGIEQRPLTTLEPTVAGQFQITCCTNTHDAVEPVSLSIQAPNKCKVGVAQDIGRATAALKFMLRDTSCLVVESNYDEMMLRSGPYPPSVQRRIAGSSGHLSNRAAGALAAELCHPDLEYVVLAHLSERCNTAEAAHSTVKAALKKRGYSGSILVAGQKEPTGPIDLHGPSPQLELEAG
jgi:phosphoribosyl 1,2-cyclic phosphodiesterase